MPSKVQRRFCGGMVFVDAWWYNYKINVGAINNRPLDYGFVRWFVGYAGG